MFTEIGGGTVSKQKASISACGMTKLKGRWSHRKENRAMACVYTRGDAKQLPVMYGAKGFDRKRLMDF